MKKSCLQNNINRKGSMPVENPQAVFANFPRIDLARFVSNQPGEPETFEQFFERTKIIPEDLAWLALQPICGDRSVERAQSHLADAGFADIHFRLPVEGHYLEFNCRLTPQVQAVDRESLVRLLIQVFRSAGYPIGFSEVGITGLEGAVVSGMAMTVSTEELEHEIFLQDQDNAAMAAGG